VNRPRAPQQSPTNPQAVTVFVCQLTKR
jgi:hypothetical protein